MWHKLGPLFAGTHQRLWDLERLASIALRLAGVVVEEVLVLVRIDLTHAHCHSWLLATSWAVSWVAGTRIKRVSNARRWQREVTDDVLHKAGSVFREAERRRSIRIVNDRWPGFIFARSSTSSCRRHRVLAAAAASKKRRGAVTADVQLHHTGHTSAGTPSVTQNRHGISANALPADARHEGARFWPSYCWRAAASNFWMIG